MLRPTGVAHHLQENLDELHRRAELESLRAFLKEYGCFNPSANPDSSSIGYDELKKLARSWKLHERRNFWKMHTTVTSMVSVLRQHVEDTGKEVRDAQSVQSSYAPMPPSESKPSKRTQKAPTNMRNIYGLQYFNREVRPSEIAIHSRFFEFPENTEDIEKALNILELEPHEEAKWTNSRKSIVKDKIRAIISMQDGVHEESHRIKLMKHRNLAQHLVNFSASPDLHPKDVPTTAIKTFVDVSESQDPLTASCALIALSNIISMPHVRHSMIELNCIHKFVSVIQHIKGPSAALAVALMFYYFSLDAEVEDRIYGVSSVNIIANSTSSNRDIQVITLKTLINLLPCGDRQKIAEVFMKAILPYADEDQKDAHDYDSSKFDREMALMYLPLLLSICSFTNTHNTLVSQDVLQFLAKIASYSRDKKDVAVGELVSKILLSLLGSIDSPTCYQIVHDDSYIYTVEKLLEVKDMEVLRNCVRIISVVSGHNKLVDAVCDGEILAVVSHTIFSAQEIPSDVAVDTAKYFSNICQPMGKEYLRRLVVEDKVPLAIMDLLGKSTDNLEAQRIGARGLQNLMSHRQNSNDLCESCLGTFVHMIDINHDVGAAESIYNMSCSPDCLEVLMNSNIHKKMLEYYVSVGDGAKEGGETQKNALAVRKVYLSVIEQMFKVNMCIDDLLELDIVEKLCSSIYDESSEVLWANAVKIVLNIVNHRDDLTEAQRTKIVGLLAIICRKGSPEDILGKASVVLAYLSLALEDFSEVDGVLRSILSLSESDLVIESVSIVLFNLTCSEAHASLLCKDLLYINIMIQIMRNGRPEVQQHIAKAMRTLCSLESCCKLLLSSPALADLIVIALLRTSSEEIKVVCSEAFYNLLTHLNQREALLKGDLYWALTRICRTDHRDIRQAAARALVDLSLDKENAASMRDHHVFTFIQELIQGADTDFIDLTMKSVQNYCSQFEAPFHLYEVSCLVTICKESLRSNNVDTLRGATALLLDISIQNVPGSDSDISTVGAALEEASTRWGVDADCRANVARFLYSSTVHVSVTKALHMEVLSNMLSVVYTEEPTAETCENILGAMRNYIMVQKSTPAEILGLTITTEAIFDAFGVGTHFSKACSFTCRALGMMVLSYIINTMLENGAMIDGGEFSTKIVHGIVTTEHLTSTDTIANNTMMVVQALSLRTTLSEYLLDADIYKILCKLVINNSGTIKERQLQYCSSIVRNISLRNSLIPRVAATKDTELDKLLEFLIENSGTEQVSYDVIVLFYKCQDYKLENDFLINSRFVLDSISKVMKRYEEGDIAKLGKYVIGEILEKYSAGISVDPVFVQSMFTEMTAGHSDEVIKSMKNCEPQIVSLSPVFTGESVEKKKLCEVAYLTQKPTKEQWNPYIIRTRTRMVTDMLDKSIIAPIVHEEVNITEANLTGHWGKIVEEHPKCVLPAANEMKGIDEKDENSSSANAEEKKAEKKAAAVKPSSPTSH